MNSDLRIKTISNIGYNSFARGSVFALATLASIILARNLTSSDYGIVGFAGIFIGFLGRFGDLGISSAVIQKGDLDERGIYTGFTIKAALGVVVFAVAFLIAPLAKTFFDNRAIVGVIRVLALNFIIGTFAFLPTSLLTRQLNYKKLFVPQVGAAIINSLLSIALVLNGFSYWSIVFANIGATVASLIILNIINPVKIKFCFNKKIASEFLTFGGNLFLSGITVFAIFNADNFTLGTVNGSKALGYYALAFNWGSMICGILYNTIHNVLFPTFSKMQEDREKLIKTYLKVLEYISFIGIMANLVLIIGSREFLVLVLGRGGEKWLPALTAFRILCVYGIFRSLLEPLANVLLAVGKTDLLFKSSLLVGIIELGFLYPAARYTGIEGVAVLVTITYALQYLVYFPYLKTKLNLNFGDVLAAIKPAIISVIFIGSISSLFQLFQGLSYFTLALKVCLATVGYSLFYGVITRWRLFYETRSIFKSMVASKGRLT